MAKKLIYKVGRKKFLLVEVTTPEEEETVIWLNREFDRTLKADECFHAKWVSSDVLFETTGFVIPDESTMETDEGLDEKILIRIHEALNRLSKKQYQYIYMHFFEDKSQAEIARELNVGEATVSTTLERAKKNFKKIFEEI